MQPAPELMPEELLRRCIEHTMRSLGSKVLGYVAREGLSRLASVL